MEAILGGRRRRRLIKQFAIVVIVATTDFAMVQGTPSHAPASLEELDAAIKEQRPRAWQTLSPKLHEFFEARKLDATLRGQVQTDRKEDHLLLGDDRTAADLLTVATAALDLLGTSNQLHCRTLQLLLNDGPEAAEADLPAILLLLRVKQFRPPRSQLHKNRELPADWRARLRERAGGGLQTVAEAVTQQVMAFGGGEGEGEARRTVLMAFECFKQGVISGIELHLLVGDVMAAHPSSGRLVVTMRQSFLPLRSMATAALSLAGVKAPDVSVQLAEAGFGYTVRLVAALLEYRAPGEAMVLSDEKLDLLTGYLFILHNHRAGLTSQPDGVRALKVIFCPCGAYALYPHSVIDSILF
jgi:hypothetical protein